MKKRVSLKYHYVRLLCVLVFAVVYLFPLFYMISMSFMQPADLYASKPRLLPEVPVLDNYISVLTGNIPIFSFLKNTVIMAVGITLVQLFICSITAYALVALRVPGANVIFIIILGGMMIPFEATMVSNYLFVSNHSLRNTYLGLILPFMVSPAGIFLMRQQFKAIPQALYDAAEMDGCNPIQLFFRILLPMSGNALASLGIFSMVSAWNQYVWPLLVTDKNEMRTVQVGISMLQGLEFSDYSVVMAGIVLVLLPCIFIFVFGYRFFVSSLTDGAIKG